MPHLEVLIYHIERASLASPLPVCVSKFWYIVSNARLPGIPVNDIYIYTYRSFDISYRTRFPDVPVNDICTCRSFDISYRTRVSLASPLTIFIFIHIEILIYRIERASLASLLTIFVHVEVMIYRIERASLVSLLTIFIHVEVLIHRIERAYLDPRFRCIICWPMFRHIMSNIEKSCISSNFFVCRYRIELDYRSTSIAVFMKKLAHVGQIR